MTHALASPLGRRRARLFGVFVLALLCTGAAKLDDRGTKEDQDACTPDVFRLCSEMIPDEPQILVCLQGKRDQLSPACSKVIGPAERTRRKRKSA